MEFSIDVDWMNYMEKGWSNEGRSVIENNCKHKTEDKGKDKETNMRYCGYCDKCGFSEDSAEPMMNYAYPLETTPSEEAILKVIQETNCTVMYNEEEDKYYLALSGGGMDLSQDIALAYNIIERWIPFELALSVSTQDGLSQCGKNFKQLMMACKESIKKDTEHGRARLKRIDEALKMIK